MKIFPIKVLSPADKINNFIKIIEQAPLSSKPQYDKEVSILNAKFTIRELRSIYKDGLKQLNRDKFEK